MFNCSIFKTYITHVIVCHAWNVVDIYFCMFCNNDFCDLTVLNQKYQPNYATFVTVNIYIWNLLTAI